MAKFDRILKTVTKTASLISGNNNNKQAVIESNISSIPKGTMYRILNDSFDVSEIKDWYLENIDFMFFPCFKEEEYEKKVLGKSKIKTKVVKTDKLVPYAAIINEEGIDIRDAKTSNFVESLAKGAIQKANDTICDFIKKGQLDLNSKLTKIVKIKFYSSDGRRFSNSISELKYGIEKIDGTIEQNSIEDIDMMVSDDDIMPIVKSVPCLTIEADRKYYYFGNGINFDDLSIVFDELTKTINEARNSLLKKENANVNTIGIKEKMKELKELFDEGLIPDDEYKKKMHDLLDKL